MAQVTKTPVMVLQELSVKRGVPPPVYELVPELTKQGTHKNEFYYEVSAFADVAYGSGSSKQIAKHDAARNMLNQLQACGLYRPSENPVQGFVPGFATLDNKPIKTSVNCIGTLCDLCEENKIPQPRFEEVSDVGPPHCRQFTYDCIVSSVRTRAMASTKKQAKQLAAEQMLERMAVVLPKLQEECKLDARQISDQDEAASSLYSQLSTIQLRKPNFACKIRDYDLVFKNIIKEKEIPIADLRSHLRDEYSEDVFNKILEKLGLLKTVITIEDTPAIVALSLSTDTPFCTVACAENVEDATDKAQRDAYNKMVMWIGDVDHFE